jgi:hypothetical protein
MSLQGIPQSFLCQEQFAAPVIASVAIAIKRPMGKENW